MTLNATPGDLSADSFVTLDEAEAYMATVFHKDTWTTLGTGSDADASKETALREATRLLAELPWVGVRLQNAQRLAWPRRCYLLSGLTQVTGGLLCDSEGYVIPSNSIPWQVKNATVAFAFRLLSEDRTADAGALVPTDLKSGTTSITGLKRSPIPAEVLDMVSPLLRCDPRNSSVLVRG